MEVSVRGKSKDANLKDRVENKIEGPRETFKRFSKRKP
jgi:hypothetical protein